MFFQHGYVPLTFQGIFLTILDEMRGRKTLSGLVLLLDIFSIQLRIGLSAIYMEFGKGDGNALPFYSFGLFCLGLPCYGS